MSKFSDADFSNLERKVMQHMHEETLHGLRALFVVIDDIDPKLTEKTEAALRNEKIMLIRGKQLCGIQLSMLEQFMLYDHEAGLVSIRETPAPPEIKSYWDGHSKDSNIKKKLPYYFNKRRF